ncbi:hypothetical protein K8089_10970 [Aequorivita sp. F47161]|uniref:Uncharacterized protein n=1 Tax=Aequorivita vitellina TaxID=2874475 RepID=A0A9X1QU67_9FLAO|nr:hypothetical protein [Aequorivita vitellina]MCG2419546.1 hypothetical protein [Aequorivita vitellina]MCZ4318744.1 hypothetical protein [Aequorivita viscosa]
MKYIVTFIILGFALIGYSQEKNCSNFRIGEFRYVEENMPEKIIRTESMQIETNFDNNVVIKSTIEWISDCTYILTYSEILNYKYDTSDIIGKKIYCEIVETNAHEFKVHAKSDTMDEVIPFLKINP